MIRHLPMLAAASAIALSSPAHAQDHAMHDMPGMAHPDDAAPAQDGRNHEHAGQRPGMSAHPKVPAAGKDMPGMDHGAHPQAGPPAMDHSAMDHSTMDHSTIDHPPMDHGAMPDMQMPAEPHAGHDISTMPAMQMSGTALPAGDAPPPPVPTDHYADRDFPPAEMARVREAMMKAQGATPFGSVLLNIFEYQAHDGRDGYRWDGQAWYGGDIHRLWLKSEGEGAFGRGLDTAEAQMLYSRAIDPYFNLQAGIRQDLGRGPKRTYAAIGFEGLAPGFFEVEGALFLSHKGDLIGRIGGYHDQRITQRLILQPRVEMNFSAQDVPEKDIGSGLVDVELGARLRYEIARQFGPYLGVSYLRKTGDTARLSRATGEDIQATSFVAGIRFWF